MKALTLTIILLVTALISFAQSIDPQHKQAKKICLYVPDKVTTKQALKINKIADSLHRSGWQGLDLVKSAGKTYIVYIKYSK